jgi:hypothetical protein
MMLPNYTTLNDKRVPSYNTKLGSRVSLIPEPRSTPSSTLISMTSNSFVQILANLLKLLSARWFHRVGGVHISLSTLSYKAKMIVLSKTFLNTYKYSQLLNLKYILTWNKLLHQILYLVSYDILCHCDNFCDNTFYE